jgi:iron(III) transport system permease protein
MQRPSSRTVVISIALVLFVACCLLPIAYLLISPLGSGTIAYGDLRLDARQQGLLRNTTLLGAGTALLATGIGAPLGLALARVPFTRKTLLRVALAAPVLLPPYIMALSWTYLGGTRGFVATLVGSDVIAEWTYSLPAAIAVLSLVFYPLSMLAAEVAIRRIDGRLEEAASLVAPPHLALRRITLPLAAPGVLAGALVIFVLAVSEFSVPGLLRVRVYTTEVFTAFAALYDFGRAVLLAIPLLVLCLVIATIAVTIVGERHVSTNRGLDTGAAVLADWRRPAGAAALATLALALALPLLVLVREALGAESLRGIVEGSGRAIANSLLFACIGATAVVGVAVWLGYARARARARVGQLADVLFVFAFAVPSTIVGVGLIGLWNRPGLLGAVYGSDAMFVLAYLARFVPVAALAIAAVTRYVPVSHEEAAAVSGAGWLRTMTHIVLPQVRLGILIAWVIAFVLAFGELGVSILVAPPGEATLPIRIYTLIANAPPSHVAILALLQTAVVLTPLGILASLISRRPSTRAQGLPNEAHGRVGR